eukprot:c39213_g1_i1.p1 GENE.c39213_g1_i1~~c39213_g1_i1.p1  ORF type:complete len:355 (+),score=65.09 c39213_g1_i1:113-1177(+)
MNLLNYDISKRRAWPKGLAYVFGGLTIPLLLGVLVFAVYNLARAANKKTRGHLVVVHFSVALLVLARLLIILLGTDNPHTFFAASGKMPEGLMQFLDNLGDGSLLASCFLELAMFVRVGWAATLKVKYLARSHKLMKLAYFACLLGVTDEVISGCLISIERRNLRIFIAIVIGLEILAIAVMLFVLFSTLLDIGSMIVQRNKVTSSNAKWSPPIDERDMHTEIVEQPCKKSPWSLTNLKMWIGFSGLPRRARLAFGAVVLGLLLIGAQCCEKFSELVLQFMGLQLFHRPELTHILYRFLEAFLGFSITYSSSTIFAPELHKAREPRPTRSEGATTKELVYPQDHVLALAEELVI